jgi:hypothetical protein
MKTRETPEKKVLIIIILKLSLELVVFNNIVSLSFRVSCQSLTSMMAWSNQPTNWSMGFPCDEWTAGRKEEEYLSHTPPKETSSETDPTVHSLIFGWAGVWGRGGRGLISRSELKKTGN